MGKYTYTQGRTSKPLICKACKKENIEPIGSSVAPGIGASFKRLKIRCNACSSESEYSWTTSVKISQQEE